MKRDLELIRKILEEIETNDKTYANEMEIDGYDSNTIAFHIDLLNEAGYVKAIIEYEANGGYASAFAERLTWQGYEFLELSRNNTLWEKAKKVLKEKSISISVSLLTELLKSIAKDRLGLSGIQNVLQ